MGLADGLQPSPAGKHVRQCRERKSESVRGRGSGSEEAAIGSGLFRPEKSGELLRCANYNPSEISENTLAHFKGMFGKAYQHPG